MRFAETPYPWCAMIAGGLTPLTNAKGNGIGPLPATSHGKESASTKSDAVSRPEPIRVSAEDTRFNTAPGKSRRSQRVPLANAKNAAEIQATVLLRVRRHARNPTRKMVRARVSPRARSRAVHG